MKRGSVLLAFSLLSGCQAETDPAGNAENAGRSSPSVTAPRAAANSLVNRVWMRTDSSQPPGAMRIFLADGTMVLDSCWETYRLAEWQELSDGTLLWQEDGADIRAQILALSENELVLRVAEDEHYTTASAPYTCPDMPR